MRSENGVRFYHSIGLTEIFGNPEDFKKSQIALARMLEPFLRCHEAALRYWAKELEPLMQLAQSEEYQAMLRNAANRLRPLSYTASDWIRDCRLGARTRERNAEPSPKPKPILGFLGGSHTFDR